jgi:hypothetical protein
MPLAPTLYLLALEENQGLSRCCLKINRKNSMNSDEIWLKK